MIRICMESMRLTEERAVLFGYTAVPRFNVGGGLVPGGEEREDKLAVCHTAVGTEWAGAPQSGHCSSQQ